MQVIKELERIPNKILLLSVFVLLLQLYNFHSAFLGKLLIVITIVFITLNHKYLGLLLTFFSLLLNQKITETVEAMETMEKQNSSSQVNNTASVNTGTNTPVSTPTSSPATNVPVVEQKNDINDIVENPIPNTGVETNDAIATFKKIHCKNGKILDKDGKEIQINDLSKYYPALKFELENVKCNPCEDSCKFKLTSSSERITVEENLRPTSSSVIPSK